MLDSLVSGILLGLAAGLSPGPLQVVVISETLRHGVWAGLRASLAPPVTDLPIIILTLMLLGRISGHTAVFGAVSLAGGAFVMYMGAGLIRAKGLRIGEGVEVARPLRNAVLVNALSPHPYLFWLTVGGPMVVRASGNGYGPPAAFIAGFYALVVGSKMALAWVAGLSRDKLTGPGYVLTMRVLGALLVVFSLLLFWEGLGLIGWA